MSNVQIQRGGNPVPVAPVFPAEVAEVASTVRSIPVQATIIGPSGYKPGCCAVLGASAPPQSHVSLASADNGSVTQNPTGVNDGLGNLVYEGPVTLTTAQWDVQTGSVGGLVPGTAYFLGGADLGSNLVTTPPSATGQWDTYIGTATTAETLNVGIRPANGPHA